MTEPSGFLTGKHSDAHGTPRQRQRATGYRLAALRELLDLGAHLRQIYSEVPQHINRRAAALFDQPQQNVLRVDAFLMERKRHLVSEHHYVVASIRKSFDHDSWLLLQSAQQIRTCGVVRGDMNKGVSDDTLCFRMPP
jgi:hypothetical protein